ncbi:TylF/MycF/NovP-related O-methyltransferase [Phenylobacterium sp.]|uniref:TylF/MycF/NovP-related O-methyltransferase n=1 Tax=Phenylobacterium sp. TaxID=1871053 RepID=UPI003983A2E0
MVQILPDNVNPELLVAFGDTALRKGDPILAERFYRAAISEAGGGAGPALHARLGLTRKPNSRTLPMLDALEAVQRIDARNSFVGEGLATWYKTPPFADDARFLDLADRHANLLPAANWHWNLQTVVWAVRQARPLPGDFVELGVFKGHTTRFVADYLGFRDWPKTWFLYDTFEGIPQDQMNAGWAANNARAYVGTFSFGEVRDRFADMANIRVVKGRVPEVLAETCPEQISFLHMDLNSAVAEVQALDILFDRITPGGVIVFDDYAWTVSAQQRAAEDAWFARRGLHILPLPTGQGLFIKG